MPRIQKDIVVDVPVRAAYDQWTQFETFPQFMDGVKEVVQLDEKTMRWRASVGGKEEEWDAEITEQTPDRIIAWHSTTGAPNAGVVRFEQADPMKTRVSLEISYEPQQTAEKVGDALGVLERRVDADLGRFKDFIEKRQTPTGGWRGEIHGGQVESGGGGARAT
ncbi:MAG: SRPBCC family protein [Chloroflexi bacterium]|nr:MAG: SRPBCC family protein [Chloroflexota bacterium]